MPDGTPATSPSLDWALAQVGDRWTLLIVHALLQGGRRFGELSDVVVGVAPNILTKRLRHLEAAGLLHSVRYQQRPARMRYELTESGHELGAALAALATWGASHGGELSAGEVPYHPACGTPLVTRRWCPTCDQPAGDSELVWL